MLNVVPYSDLVEPDQPANDSGYDCDRSPEPKIIVDDDKELNDEEIDVEGKTEEEKKEDAIVSWHPHVYGKPPKKPTPHTIENILGLNKVSVREKSVQVERRDVKCYDGRKVLNDRKVQEDRNVLDDRKLNKNRLQEQLLQRVRTSDSEVDRVYAFKDDQPLNLSVPRSKEWRDDERNKGEELVCRNLIEKFIFGLFLTLTPEYIPVFCLQYPST